MKSIALFWVQFSVSDAPHNSSSIAASTTGTSAQWLWFIQNGEDTEKGQQFILSKSHSNYFFFLSLANDLHSSRRRSRNRRRFAGNSAAWPELLCLNSNSSPYKIRTAFEGKWDERKSDTMNGKSKWGFSSIFLYFCMERVTDALTILDTADNLTTHTATNAINWPYVRLLWILSASFWTPRANCENSNAFVMRRRYSAMGMNPITIIIKMKSGECYLFAGPSHNGRQNNTHQNEY